jgi:hypothetical protein
MRNLHLRTPSARPIIAADLYRVAPGVGALGTERTENDPLPPPSQTYQYPVSYEIAYRALASAQAVAEVNDILAIAAAMEAHARHTNDRGLELDAIELRFHAECRLDDMITDRNC